MIYHLAGLISFDSNAQRNRAQNAVERWVSNWNGSHPTAEDLTLVRMNQVTLPDYDDNGDVVPGVSLPGVDFEYTSPSQNSIETAQAQLYTDTASNNYNDIHTLSTWAD